MTALEKVLALRERSEGELARLHAFVNSGINIGYDNLRELMDVQDQFKQAIELCDEVIAKLQRRE